MPAIKVTTEIELGFDTAAEWFCGLDDDQMAQFLTAIATKAETMGYPMEVQWSYLGGHLRNCKCVPEATRKMLRDWLYWMEHGDHGAEAA